MSSIFSGSWRQKDQLRKEIVLAKNFENREIRMSYILDFIPWSWRDIVCICDKFGVGTTKCPRCNKYARWKFRRSCSMCGKPFIKDFHHPKDSGRECFDCLVGKHGLMDGENFVTVKPKELTPLEDREVFQSPDLPSFDF